MKQAYAVIICSSEANDAADMIWERNGIVCVIAFVYE